MMMPIAEAVLTQLERAVESARAVERRARARTLSKARRDAFGRLLLMRRNFRLRALSELSKAQGFAHD